jgi:glycosyltransferase involved in cell wall biosynthesis
VLVGGPADAGDAYRRRLGAHGEKLVVLADRTPEQVVALTRRADVLVHTRLACRENYSVQSKLAVYLAAGRPIVATDFGDYRELLGATGAGRLTAVEAGAIADGILAVLSDPALAASLSAATGPVAREHFGMDRNLDRYLAVYSRAVAMGPQTRKAPAARPGPPVRVG